MADTKISALTAATAAAGANEIPINEAGANKKVTIAQIASILGGSGFNFPAGFLINGKIVPSVASNDLTVAIKGLDGNDPSATNPIYCRIGDTIQSITDALSVTCADGTNWFNAGGAELATKEIDYFVYLGYNATDGVVIGFSRIPYGNIYSNFSTTNTNEKFCAISTITNAAATDNYENIGRFAATLSAGAGYTWTVPTFTGDNLIQRPIFETRLLIWTPAGSASGSMTYTSISISFSQYQIIMNKIFLNMFLTGTTGGTASTDINITLPFKIISTSINSCGILDGNYVIGKSSVLTGSNSIAFGKYDTSNWALESGKRVMLNHIYLI